MRIDRLRVILLVFAAAMAIAACSGLRVESGVSDVDGRAVEKLADAGISSQIRPFDPKISILPTTCPAHLDLSNAKIGKCTIVIDGVTLPVNVSFTSSNNQINAYLDGSFFERNVLDAGVGAELKQLGIPARARCPMPAVMAFQKGTVLKCTISVGAKTEVLEVTTEDNGRVHVALPKDLGILLDPETRRALRAHKAGERTTMSGTTVAKKIDDNALLVASVIPTKAPTVHTHCPANLDLTDGNRPTCVVMVAGHAVTFAVWIDNNTLHFEPTEAIVDLTRIQDLEEKLLNQSLEESGNPALTKVDCGTGIAVFAVPAKFTCDVLIGAYRHKLEVDVTDVYGHVNMHII